jgi:protein phosphatase 1 regulatory subunit 7
LKRLILIANCIEKIENLEANTELVHLELYQNLVKRIENISHLTKLEILDFSFNKIRDTFPLEKCPFSKLQELYLCSNKIEDIEGIWHMTELVMCEFGANRIRSIPGEFVNLTKLQELWLGKNKISCMGLPPMPALRRLSLQNNRLETWDESLFFNAPNHTHL